MDINFRDLLKHIHSAEEELLVAVATQCLKRKPTQDDKERFLLVKEEPKPYPYFVYFDGIYIGQVEVKLVLKAGEPIEFVFTPVNSKP